MTNTKFRKRALLSSVAMLLVALVALGSATFAWFVANPTVSASGLKLQTKAAAGLTVASASAKKVNSTNAFDFSTVLDARNYDATNSQFVGATSSDPQITLDPYSLDTSVTSELKWAKAVANDHSASPKASDATYDDSSATFADFYKNNDTAGSGIYRENIYVKTSASAQAGETVYVKSIKVTLNTTNTTVEQLGAGVRVAIADKEGKLLGVWKPSTTSGTKCWDSTDTNKVANRNASFKNNGDVYSFAVDSETGATALAATSDPNANYITAYVYLDGEDTAVFTDNVTRALEDLISSLTIEISSNVLSAGV